MANHYAYPESIGNDVKQGQHYVLFSSYESKSAVAASSIVKSSIALSLGLVGALSIIRFRTPIKEPEELAYIFIAIAIGLGLGAGQYLITTIFFVIICLVMLVLRLTNINVFSKEKSEYVFIDLVINKKQNQNFDLIQLIQLIKSDLDNFQIKSLEENKQNLELTLLIKNFDYEKIEKVRKVVFCQCRTSTGPALRKDEC